jgi:aspartyl-tRNA(Asn)/glutamyl-tRNA(Gln) amidotransferase subunit C
MKLSREQVAHIADLARLELTEEELVLYQEQLSTILNYAERLRGLDTEDIAPTARVLSSSGEMRPDEVVEPSDREEILANAPDEAEGCFRVPAVLE